MLHCRMVHHGAFCPPEISRRTSSTRPPKRCTSSVPPSTATKQRKQREARGTDPQEPKMLTHFPSMPFRICGVRESTVRVQRSPSEKREKREQSYVTRLDPMRTERRKPTRPSSAGSCSAARNSERRDSAGTPLSSQLFDPVPSPEHH